MITITKPAAARINAMITKRGKGLGLRVAVKESGCSGYRYDLGYVDDITEEDSVFEQQGATVVIDKNSMLFLDELELDFVKNGLNQHFQFNNPNVVSSCGCGESFSVTK